MCFCRYDKVSIATSEVNADSALASEGFTNSVILQRSPVGTARTAEDAQCSSENG